MTIPEDHINHIRTIAMTESERLAVRGRLRAFTAANPAAGSVPVRAWHWALRHGTLALGLAVIVIIGGTGVSAERAHPGDFLYGFRTLINDRINTALAFSEDARIDAEMAQMQRLLDDEDVARDVALDAVAYAPDDAYDDDDDEELERELRALEQELADEERALDVERLSSPTPESFDDGSLESELEDLERELDLESDMEVELES